MAQGAAPSAGSRKRGAPDLYRCGLDAPSTTPPAVLAGAAAARQRSGGLHLSRGTRTITRSSAWGRAFACGLEQKLGQEPAHPCVEDLARLASCASEFSCAGRAWAHELNTSAHTPGALQCQPRSLVCLCKWQLRWWHGYSPPTCLLPGPYGRAGASCAWVTCVPLREHGRRKCPMTCGQACQTCWPH